jgi:hypothetical protein
MSKVKSGRVSQPPQSLDPVQNVISEPDSHQEIASLAYELWSQRGSPVGSPEEDWFRAEEQFRSRKASEQSA